MTKYIIFFTLLQVAEQWYTRNMLVAVDTGGTKTLVASFDRRGRLVAENKFATPRDKDEYIESVSISIRALLKDNELDAISVAVPGVVEGDSAKWCANLGWTDFPVGQRLKRRFNVPVFLENDANLAGLAEARSLPRPPRLCLYLTISTGIGMGVTVDGSLHPAFKDTEAGHMMLEYDGRLREWEHFASGKSIHRLYGKKAKDIHNKHIWKQIADKISRGILVLSPTLNPNTIIIGGSIGTYFDRYEKYLLHILQKHHNPNLPLPEIRQALHPEQAVIYGCYYYAIDSLNL